MKIGVCRGIPTFLIFDPKHRLWVLVRTASPILSKHNKDINFFSNHRKFSIFTAVKMAQDVGLFVKSFVLDLNSLLNQMISIRTVSVSRINPIHILSYMVPRCGSSWLKMWLNNDYNYVQCVLFSALCFQILESYV